MVYPNIHQEHPDKTRSIILINTDLLTDNWKQIHFQYPDITAIEITGDFSMLQIINIYNNGDNNDTLKHISAYMQDRDRQQHIANPLHTIWMGDFNQHHLLWDKPRNMHLFTWENLDLMQPLLNLLG